MESTDVPQLPPPTALERICRGLAALDAMLCAEWEGRLYSFNQAWNPDRGERMASMRSGSGDDWFLVFAPGGVFLKAFWHEYPGEDVAAIYEGLPDSLAAQLTEPAFSMADVTFGGWHDGTRWTLRGNAAPMLDELTMLTGDPMRYQAYASSYFEAELPLDEIAHVLAGRPLDDTHVAQISIERTLAELQDDLAEIGYGRHSLGIE
jgi:hypothetical protein